MNKKQKKKIIELYFRFSNFFVFGVFILLFVVLLFTSAYGQESSQPQQEPVIWVIDDQDGKSLQLRNMTGNFNLHTTVGTSSPGTTGDELGKVVSDVSKLGFSFVAINDDSLLMVIRAFLVHRKEALDKNSENMAVLYGFKWDGDVTVAVMGNENYAYYGETGQTRTLPEKYLTMDFTSSHQSEREYINKVLKKGAYKITATSYFTQIQNALDNYLSYWAEEGVDLDQLIQDEDTKKKLRQDLDDRLKTVNSSLKTEEAVDSFSQLKSWIKNKGKNNEYFSAMLCQPSTSQTTYSSTDFFENNYDSNLAECVPLIEVTEAGEGNSINSSRYKTALKYRWKVAPVTTLDNSVTLSQNDTNFFTGIWTESQSTTTESYEIMLKNLQALRKRRTYVSHLKGCNVRLVCRDADNQVVALMGEEITRSIPIQIDLTVDYTNAEGEFYLQEPRLIITYNDNSQRAMGFSCYYNNVVGDAQSNTKKLYRRQVDDISNIRSFYGSIYAYQLNSEAYDENWSYYKVWKYFRLGLIDTTSYEIITAPVFVDAD